MTPRPNSIRSARTDERGAGRRASPSPSGAVLVFLEPKKAEAIAVSLVRPPPPPPPHRPPTHTHKGHNGALGSGAG